ncbi:MAG: MgtC/SapB family protein [Bacillota bacterium]
MDLSQREMIIRLSVALIIGATLGYERTKNKKPAGIRTHALVCISCTTISMVSAYGFAEFAQVRTMDPARLIVGIITGIGFLGAGIIWKEGHGIHGLTTAANIWAIAGLGIAIGLGHFFLAVVTVLFILTALHLSKILKFIGLLPVNNVEKAEKQDED